MAIKFLSTVLSALTGKSVRNAELEAQRILGEAEDGKRRLVFCLLFSFILGSIIREVPLHLMDVYDVESLFSLSQIKELNFIQYFIVSYSRKTS